jgi:hypothetical protein
MYVSQPRTKAITSGPRQFSLRSLMVFAVSSGAVYEALALALSQRERGPSFNLS